MRIFCNPACTKEKLSQKVGCRLPWDKWSAQDRNVCKYEHQFRQFEQIYNLLKNAESFEILQMTGCKEPCSYNKYSFASASAEVMPKIDGKPTSGWIVFWGASNRTWTEEEILLYPFTSLIAEFGGSLGLFLGFSFMAIWDTFLAIYSKKGDLRNGTFLRLCQYASALIFQGQD